jgi:hypothetical protein
MNPNIEERSTEKQNIAIPTRMPAIGPKKRQPNKPMKKPNRRLRIPKIH